MQISLLLMEEIAKLFAIMLMGYAVVKAGLMKSSESKSISVVMVYLVIPCVIIDAFQVDYTPDVKKGLLLACAAAVLVHVLFLILTTILKQVLRLDTIERATVIYSNAGILVIPLVQDLLGKEYVIYSSAYITVQLVLIWTHCKNMICEEDRLEWKKVFLNVNIISIIVGVILFVCRIQMPSGVQDVMDMMNNMIGPIGMLLAGMVIADVPLKIVFTKKETIFQQISTAKKLDANDVFIYSAIIYISASQYCISNTAVTQIELFRAFKVFLTSDVISLNIIKYKSIAQILNVLADGYMIGYQIDEYP